MAQNCPEFNCGVDFCVFGAKCTYLHKINELRTFMNYGKCIRYIRGYCKTDKNYPCNQEHDPLMSSYFIFNFNRESLMQSANLEEIIKNAVQYEYDTPIFGRKQKIFYELSLPYELLPRGVSKIVLDYLLIPPKFCDGEFYTLSGLCSFCELVINAFPSGDAWNLLSKNKKMALIVCNLCSRHLRSKLYLPNKRYYDKSYKNGYQIKYTDIAVKDNGLIHKVVEILPNSRTECLKYLGIEDFEFVR